MDDLVKRLRAPKSRPTSPIQLGNGQTVSGFALMTFHHDDELHDEAAAAIEARDAMLRECVEAMVPVLEWLNHINATGSRRLSDTEYPEVSGMPIMGTLRDIRTTLAKAEEMLK
jgi:hypothetical protein